MMIGILGGGQLGRMLALAAARLGIKTHIYCPDPQSPAFDVTPHKTIAAYDDHQALKAFADTVDFITYEFENIPDGTVDFLAAVKPLHPNATALRVAQDRLREKAFLKDVAPIADFRPVNSFEDLKNAVTDLGIPGVLKTTRFGYDGKGQRILRNPDDLEAAYEELAGQPLVFEAFVPFSCEISVIAARNAKSDIRTYDPAENVHVNHILSTSTVPANCASDVLDQAKTIAANVLNALDYQGVMGIEFFVVSEGSSATLLVNEIAPRVHNSGHWTEAVCVTDQFEQHIRAIANLPLGSTDRFADVQMKNLIGDEIDTLLAAPNARPHAYGKAESRPGRKMGHINVVRPWK